MARWEPNAEGRLVKAALELFDTQGYEGTTVADIAERAGLTKRTFFRYFSDKREVLFNGSADLGRLWVGAVTDAPAGAGPMEAIEEALDATAVLFADRHPFARVRAGVIVANPELQERELIKLERLAASVAGALQQRGTDPGRAALAAQTGVQVFRLAFDRWIAQEDSAALRPLMFEALRELRSLLEETPPVTRSRIRRPG